MFAESTQRGETVWKQLEPDCKRISDTLTIMNCQSETTILHAQGTSYHYAFKSRWWIYNWIRYYVQLGLSDCPCIAGARKIVLGPWLPADLFRGFSPSSCSGSSGTLQWPKSINSPTIYLHKEHQTSNWTLQIAMAAVAMPPRPSTSGEWHVDFAPRTRLKIPCECTLFCAVLFSHSKYFPVLGGRRYVRPSMEQKVPLPGRILKQFLHQRPTIPSLMICLFETRIPPNPPISSHVFQCFFSWKCI